MRMEYLAAERALVRAEGIALGKGDFDTLSRLYMPLQEARRQRRQLCGEGIVRLDLLASGPDDLLDPGQIISQYPQGQLLVAGWTSIEPAMRIRQIQAERGLYVETYLAAVYPMGDARAVVIVPTADVLLPQPPVASIDLLINKLPQHSIVLHERELPRGQQRGDTQTYAHTMALWERLHTPFLAAADMQVDLLRKIDGYRRTIAVDYACELAHQKLSDTARRIAQQTRAAENAPK